MNYLQAVNGVLRRLRENEVGTVDETAYSRLIGDFVNDAKSLVEVAWSWSGLKTTLTITTVENTFNYSLTGSQNTVKIMDVVNDTTNGFMTYQDQHWMSNAFFIDDLVYSSPTYYSTKGLDVNGDTAIEIYPIPDGVYSLRFNVVKRMPELTEGATDIVIPTQPIIHLALAMAARERGETGGTSVPEYFAMADNFLADAIAMDANKTPEELIFRYI
jgi:hypothetical protein